jgi:hypothetical protein
VFAAMPAMITVTETTIPSPTVATATDNCVATPTITSVDGTTVSETAATCYGYRYYFIRTWTATDGVNSSTKTQRITVTGIRLSCPSNKTFNTNSDGTADYNCSTIVKASDALYPIFTDGCSTTALRYSVLDPSGATRTGSGSITGLALFKGTTTVTYNLAFSSSETCSFTVTVNDTEAPKFPAALTTVVLDACDLPTGLALEAALPNPTGVTDNCNMSSAITYSVVNDVQASLNCVSGTTKYSKTIVRTWRATDASGNSSTKTQRLYIRDNTAPTASCKSTAHVVTVTNTNVSVPASALNNSSSDNCTAAGSLVYAIARQGTTTYAANLTLSPSLIPANANHVLVPVTLRVTDGCGNVSTCNGNVRLQRSGTTDKVAAPSNNEPTLAPSMTPQVVVPSNVDATHGKLKCFPNPFMDNLNLEYNLAYDVTNVVLKVYDNQGKLVTTSEQGEQFAGYYTMNWNLSDLSAGMYHVCLEIDGKCSKMERVIVLK